jgi:lipopolysaccharide biosynthesis regulator YciM
MRLRGIGPEVLLLCFLLVGAAAFLLGRRTSRGRRLRREVEYFTGLDHLVNDRYDRATEVFTRLATKSHEADIQFALGSLHRRRGEVDRAIAIHTELAQHRDPALREQANYALALDYMSAGLLDRAEERLRGLMSSRYRAQVLEKLAWVYEQQREWGPALEIWRELPAEEQRERAAVAAHYCCELGEAALARGDLPEAKAQLAAARTHDPKGARVAMLAARHAAASGERARALELYAVALGASRAMREAHENEAMTAVGADLAPRLAEMLRAMPVTDTGANAVLARFRCTDCGVTSVTWHWRCPSCRSWDSMASTQ